jgi:hypothetical protein
MMSYVIRNEDGRYLQVWFSHPPGVAFADAKISRVELVSKAEASSYRTRAEARREVLDKYPGSNFTVEVR